MSQKQFFEGFSEEQQAEYEKEAAQMFDPETVQASSRKWKSYSAADKARIQEEGNAVYEGFLQAMPKGPESPEAQSCVARWRKHIEYFWTPDDEQLLGLANGYNDDERFKASFDKIDPNLAGFIRAAVEVYVRGRRKE